ncbi:hypothetical protein SORBI_3010G013400 [Sorghum bicolor]|uniref:Uncharacterized protein n=1 Tax=Sorghum bicolor TaxID=4558 RepID=A0A194YGT6_SORBI|nr:hypothetical protein SORBI_3010G013400 [Sorghum bicolor]
MPSSMTMSPNPSRPPPPPPPPPPPSPWRTASPSLHRQFVTESSVSYQAEVGGFQHDGSLHLQARSEKYGKLERGPLRTVPPYIWFVKRKKQQPHHLEKYSVELSLGCDGFMIRSSVSRQ